MRAGPRLACPRCGCALASDPTGGLSCPAGHFEARWQGAWIDMRRSSTTCGEPEPATTAALERELERLAAGLDYKTAFEELLLELEEEAGERLMLLVKESRGAWLALLEAGAGEALFLGNPFSGTPVALAQAGFRATVIDCHPLRLRHALHHLAAHFEGRGLGVVHECEPPLPFLPESFDLVVCEEAWLAEQGAAAARLAELARLTRGELVLCTENRLAYKRSRGSRGRFEVPGPVQWLRRALRPRGGERSLRGWRALLAGELAAPRAFALYPHAREFSHVVALDAPRPGLTIGPKERRNLPKLVAKRVGLFPWLTPSYLWLARKSGARGRTRIERVVAELAERLDEPTPEVELCVATRSDTCLVHTTLPGRSEEDPRGRWTLHIPLSPQKRHLLAKHQRFLALVRERFPAVPVPEPLFAGEIEGLWLGCERRLGGLTAPHRSGERRVTARMLPEVAAHCARLVLGQPLVFDEALYEELVRPRFAIVERHAGLERSRQRLRELEPRVKELLLGARMPLVLYHADLRSKHVQIDAAGHVLGYLDWGASEERFLPYVDLLHLVAHERKQEEGASPARSWQIVRERRELRPYEREALEGYAERLGISDEVRRALELAYPVWVTAMAELNWAYSRPRWLARQFGV